jgi:hypothetical protein
MFARFSMRPDKQAMYFLLARDGLLSKGKAVGVDFGCGAMLNRRIFRTKEYWGVDLDEPTLRKGLRRFPKAKASLSKIEEANVPPADFAICTNVFAGTNFGKEGARYNMMVLEKIIDRVAENGTLIVTFNPKKNGPELIDRLRERFGCVTEIGINLPRRRTPLAPFIAIGYLRRSETVAKPTRLYVRCERKLGS